MEFSIELTGGLTSSTNGMKGAKAAAAHAQASRRLAQLAAPNHALPGTRTTNWAATVSELASDIIEDDDDCGYMGGVNHSCTDSEYEPSMDSDSDSDDKAIELEGEELEKNLAELRNEVEELKKKTPYEHVLAAGSMSAKQWKKAESQQKLGYTGTSLRTHQWHAKAAWEQEQVCQAAKTSFIILSLFYSSI